MDQSQLKTSWKTRIVIGVIAFLMLFSTVAVYALIVLSGENKKKTDINTSEELKAVEADLKTKRNEVETLAVNLSNEQYTCILSFKRKVIQRSFC